MNKFIPLLQTGDLRTTGKVDDAVKLVTDQKSFDLLFNVLYSSERGAVLRAADAIEKITITHPEYLAKHKAELMALLKAVTHIELKWHLAQLITRLPLNKKEINDAWDVLCRWVKDKNESRIVRVNSLQALFELAKSNPRLKKNLSGVFSEIQNEKVPSLVARLKKIQKKIEVNFQNN